MIIIMIIMSENIK